MPEWKLNPSLPQRPIPGTVVESGSLKARYIRYVGWIHENEHRPIASAAWPRDRWPDPQYLVQPGQAMVGGASLFVRDDGGCWTDLGKVEAGETVIDTGGVKAVVLSRDCGHTLVRPLGRVEAWSDKAQVIVTKGGN